MTKDKNDWGKISREFNHISGEYLKNQWQENGFDYQETMNWINADLRPWESNIAWWARDNGKNPKSFDSIIDKESFEEEKIKWKQIDSTFYSDQFVEWQKRDFNYQATKNWIEIGLVPKEYDPCLLFRK